MAETVVAFFIVSVAKRELILMVIYQLKIHIMGENGVSAHILNINCFNICIKGKFQIYD